MGDSHSQRAGGHAQGPDMLGESNGACEKEEGFENYENVI